MKPSHLCVVAQCKFEAASHKQRVAAISWERPLGAYLLARTEC